MLGMDIYYKDLRIKALGAGDAHGYFGHCGYVKPQDHPL